MQVAKLKIGILMYFVGTDNIYALLLNQEGQSQIFSLMTCERAFPLIYGFLRVIEEPTCTTSDINSQFCRFSQEWGRELLPPITHIDPFDILVIIPHYILNVLPFHIISLQEKQQFLGTSHGITYCSSNTLFTRCVDRNVIRKLSLSSWEFFLDEKSPVNAPESPKSCLGVGIDVKQNKTEEYQSLVKNFTGYFQQSLVTSDRSTLKMAVKQKILQESIDELGDIQKYDSICIACHGYYDRIVSDNSGLLLEGGRHSERAISLHRGIPYFFRDLPFSYPPPTFNLRPDCEVELTTISELKVDVHTKAQLVALFGCFTATGYVLSGDNFNSLAYQWLKVGASSVLANLWTAKIDFITKWSSLFLDNWLRKRQPKAIAWQQALKVMIDQDTTLKEDLSQWGCIILLGDWL